MSVGFEWQSDPSEVFSRMVDDYIAHLKQAIRDILLAWVPQVEAYLKAEAPWVDRTGNLRQSLHAEFEQMADALVLKLDYGLEYGYWLEFGKTGEYAIIAPAVDHFWPLIWKDIENLLRT